MFADVADKPGGARGPARPAQSMWDGAETCGRARLTGGRVTRGRRLNMANNPKKAKDPTEVALSAIQEALNISDIPVDSSRSGVRTDAAPAETPPAIPNYDDTSFDFRPG